MSYESEISDGLRDRHERQWVTFEANLPERLREAIADGEIEKCPIITKWEICDVCDGEGGHSRRFGVMIGSEIEDMDEEFWDSYVSGNLDEPCRECHSTGKVQVLNEEELSLEAQRFVESLRQDLSDRHSEEWAERFC